VKRISQGQGGRIQATARWGLLKEDAGWARARAGGGTEDEEAAITQCGPTVPS